MTGRRPGAVHGLPRAARRCGSPDARPAQPARVAARAVLASIAARASSSSTPPPGVTTMTPSLRPPRAGRRESARAHEWGPFAPQPLPSASADRRRADLPLRPRRGRRRGRAFRDRAHARRRSSGTTAWGDRSRLPFHVTSSDWQESDQVLAGIMTDFGSPTGAGRVRRPRRVRRRDDRRVPAARASRARSPARICARWDTLWGDGTAHESSSRTATSTSPTASSGRATPRFAPTACSRSAIRARDGGEEIDARIPRRAARSRQPAPRVRASTTIRCRGG